MSYIILSSLYCYVYSFNLTYYSAIYRVMLHRLHAHAI